MSDRVPFPVWEFATARLAVLATAKVMPGRFVVTGVIAIFVGIYSQKYRILVTTTPFEN
jgi:hypothetical protein